MPPHPQYPYQPTGSPDLYPGNPVHGSGVYAGGYRPQVATGRPRFVTTDTGVEIIPNDWTDEDAAAYVQAWNQKVAKILATAKASSGWEREKLLAQYEDAKKGRDNALEIARLNNTTSSQNVLAQLKEQGRQFDLRHGLETQQLGLDRAKTATDFLATPDRYAQAGNYLALSGRVLAGQPGAGAYGRDVAPRANTEQDFAVLQSGGNPYANRGDASAAAAGGGGAGGDARQKALKAVISGYQPSNGVGLDPNDYAVLNASRAIMNMNLTPQQQATVNSNSEYKGILGSNLRNLGQDPNAWWQRQQQALPGQGRASAA